MPNKTTLTKLALILYLLFYCNLIYGQDGLTRIDHYGTNPGNLSLFFHLSKNHSDPANRKPLVVVLHGCSQNAKTIASQSGWNKLADDQDFHVLYSQQKIANNPNRCFNWYSKHNILKDQGEVLSIKQMIDFAIDTFPIDTEKIFVYGLSAGAAMSVALMVDYPGLFNAGAILAGGPYMSASNPIDGLISMVAPGNRNSNDLAQPVIDQNPDYKNKYPQIIIIHGKQDPVVNIKNAHQLIQQWSFLHHTDTIADVTINAFDNNPDITKYIYRDSANVDVMVFYEVDHLGHAIMIDPGDEIDQGGETGMFTVDKDFYSTYWIARDFGLMNH